MGRIYVCTYLLITQQDLCNLYLLTFCNISIFCSTYKYHIRYFIIFHSFPKLQNVIRNAYAFSTEILLHATVLSNFYENLKNRHLYKLLLLQIGIALASRKTCKHKWTIDMQVLCLYYVHYTYTLHTLILIMCSPPYDNMRHK